MEQLTDQVGKGNSTIQVFGQFVENQVTLKVASGENGHAGSVNNEYWHEETISAVTGNKPVAIKATPNNNEFVFDHWELLDEHGTVINQNVSTSQIYTPQRNDDPNANGLWTTRTYKAIFRGNTSTVTNPPAANIEYTVRYVVPAKYTYNNQEIKLCDDVTITVGPNEQIQNKVEQKSFARYSQDKPYRIDDLENRVITCNYKPVQLQLNLHFLEVDPTDHSKEINGALLDTYSINGLWYGQDYPISTDITGYARLEGKTLDAEYELVRVENPQGTTTQDLVYHGTDDKRDYYLYYTKKTNDYKVTYRFEGDIPSGVSAPAEETHRNGDTVSVQAAPSAAGYTFEGWKRDGSPISGSFTMPNANVEIVGKWTLNSYRYTIHHYLKGTTIRVKDDESGTAASGSTVTVTPVTTYQERDLTVDSYNPSQSITISEGNNEITVYYTLPLTITATTATKVYDGTALTGGYTVEGALEGDVTVIQNALGEAPSITDVGSREYPTAEDQAKITGIPAYYTVSYTPGTLTVRAKVILYNYITFDGTNYLSLEPTEIVAAQPASAYLGKGDLTTEDYEADPYDLSRVSWYKKVSGSNPAKITYVNQSVAKPGQPYYTAELERVFAAKGAPYKTGTMEPVPAEYSADANTAVFHRYYRATLSGIPKTETKQPLLTAIAVNGRYYAVEWDDDFPEGVDSRFVPFSYDLVKGVDYSGLADYDFTDVVVTDADGIRYVNVNSAAHKNDPSLPYYTTSLIHIRKENKTKVSYGPITDQARDNWRDVNGNPDPTAADPKTVAGWDKPGDDGYPYKAGFYHRDYNAQLKATWHKVTFKDWDETVLSGPTQYKHTTPAGKVTKPKNPTREEDHNYTYEFAGWDKPIADVMADATYTATYKPVNARYTIHHYLEGTTIKVADDQTGKMKIGEILTAEASGSIYDAFPATITVSSYSKTDGKLKISETIADNEIIVYYKVPLTVTATTASKTYDGQPLNGSYTVDGALQSDETVIQNALGTAPSITNAGTRNYLTTEDQARITGIPGYYDVVYVPGTLTITKATATVTAEDKTKVYGDDDPELTATVTGLKNGDEASVITYTLSRAAGEDVGTYAITPAGAAEQGNYDVVYVPGTLTITKATATVTAEDKTKVYGDDDPELTATVTGLKNGDDSERDYLHAEPRCR